MIIFNFVEAKYYERFIKIFMVFSIFDLGHISITHKSMSDKKTLSTNAK